MTLTDARLQLLHTWLQSTPAGNDFELVPASSDASFRRYFRLLRGQDEPTQIAMDAPPPQEDCRPFVHIAGLLTDAGVHAPAVFAQDLQQGFLLLSDLGSRTYLDELDQVTAPQLYADACASLVKWQLASRSGVLPDYGDAPLRRELQLFPDWYIARELAYSLGAEQLNVLNATFELILANNLAQPKVFVHRDYHSRNLMVSTPNPGVLDFQDAVYGPITYDLVSLLRDAYVSWEEDQVLDWTIRYWDAARRAGLPVRSDFADFYCDFEWMGVQRQLKVLGIFSRLAHRDGKTAYLRDMPTALGYLRAACGRYRELKPLLHLLDQLDARESRVGYTF